MTIPVNNLAKNGRSTRSFINEGLWAQLLDATSAGDFVIIEMGHNDDGDPTDATSTSADRATLPGIGNDSVVVTTSAGTTETVHSFGWYLREMIANVRAKGAIPLISGMVNRNYWSGNTLTKDWPFATYAQEIAAQLGVEYIDHTNYSVAAWQTLGPTAAKTYFPNDNTHTSWPGARINTETFVAAVKCRCGGSSVLLQSLNAAGNAVNQSCSTCPKSRHYQLWGRA